MNKDDKFKLYKKFNEALKNGQLPVFRNNNILTIDKLKRELIEEIKSGCDKELTGGNCCMYVSSRGNNIYCPKCKKRLEYLRSQ